MSCNSTLIDGSKLEGGGQILRMATALSCLLKTPVKVSNIRGNRSKPGLKAQHLTGLELLRDLSQGELSGGFIDSSTIELNPAKVLGGSFIADVKTAGSISLLIQSVLPCALFGEQPSQFDLKGGTNADMAPQLDYTIEVFRKIAEKFRIHFDLSLIMRGFFPAGNGKATLTVHPLKDCIQPIEMLDQGKVTEIKGVSFVAGTLPMKSHEMTHRTTGHMVIHPGDFKSAIRFGAGWRHLVAESSFSYSKAMVAHAMTQSAESVLRKGLLPGVKISISTFKENSSRAFGNGSSIILWTETSTGCILGASALGKRGVRAEDVGMKAAEELLQTIFSKSCVDSYSQDQVIIFMALAAGKSRIRTTELTLHSQTAIYIAELMTKVKFHVIEEKEFGTIILECDGIGMKPTL